MVELVVGVEVMVVVGTRLRGAHCKKARPVRGTG